MTLARSTVYRESRSRTIEEVHDAEFPTRFVQQLASLLQGQAALGVRKDKAYRVVARVARDSMPPSRWRVLSVLSDEPQATSTIASMLDLPTTSAKNALEDLQVRGIVKSSRQGQHESSPLLWKLTPAGVMGVGVLTLRVSPEILRSRMDTGIGGHPSDGGAGTYSDELVPHAHDEEVAGARMDIGVAGLTSQPAKSEDPQSGDDDDAPVSEYRDGWPD